MEIYKDADSVFKFRGSLTYLESQIKSVKVDGETYHKTSYVNVTKTVDELRSSHKISFNIINYDFKEINCKVKIEDYNHFSLAKIRPYTEYSNNDEVNLIMRAFDNGFLDEKIKSVYTTKIPHYYPLYYNEDWDYILTSMLVKIPLFRYGFNNYVCYDISVKDLFDIEFDKIPQSITKIFIKNGIDLKSKNKFKELIKLASKKIRKHEAS